MAFSECEWRIFWVFLPAKMSCKLWLNVWTCRSFTCPFTLRNLDRNPTAALISGFMVPRAQRVCIEKGDGPRAVVVFLDVFVRLFVSTSEQRSLSAVLCLLAFISRGRGKVFLSFQWESVCQDGSVLGNRRLLLVNTGGWRGGPLVPRCPTLPSLFPPPE